MNHVYDNDLDAFAIVKRNGKWFGGTWYKKFDRTWKFDVQRPVELNRLNKTGPGWNDIYIRKSSIACDASVDDAAICCANSIDDLDDPFIQACGSVVYERTTY